MTESINGLSSNFTLIIDSIMTYERQPLQTLTSQKDQINVRRGAFLDLSNKLNSLQSAVRGLVSSDVLSVLKPGRTVSVTPGLVNTSVATANVESSAIPGTYELSVTRLARAERYTSAVQTSARQALGKLGALWVGGTDQPAAAIGSDAGGVLEADSAAVSVVTAGQRELSSGAYTVETRETETGRQFRLVDADGKAVQVADRSRSGAMTASWQDLPTGEFDTGRGLTLSFTGAVGDAATVNYTARGVRIEVSTTDSLVSIANKINESLQPGGHDAVASVVGSQLVLTAAATGDQHTVQLLEENTLDPETSLLGLTRTQTAQNALFTMNGVEFNTQANTGLKDVVLGMTINLAADAQSTDGSARTAVIQVNKDYSTATTGVQTFISKFNEVQSYIASKTAITKTDDKTFTRGVMANDTNFNDLRDRLFSFAMFQSSSNSTFRSLNSLGISIGSDMTLSISDSSKLQNALENNFEDASSLLNEVMQKMYSQLQSYTKTDGYMSTVIKGFDSQTKELTYSITSLETRLAERKEQLVAQYGEMQAMLLSMSYQQQTLNSMFSVMSSLV